MTRSRPPQVAFNSGEISPKLWRRFDYQRHQTGLARCRGFVPSRQGLVSRAPGTWFRGYTKDDAAARMIEFEFAENDALTLEFTAGAMRVWRYGALVMDGASPYELTTPFEAADLARLSFAQSADVIYLADGARPIQKLSRLALDDWTLEPFEPQDGPFRVVNLDDALTVQASAATGTGITLTASAALFEADHVGSLMLLEPEDLTSAPGWTGNVSVSDGARVRYDGNTYELDIGGGSVNVGPVPPQHLRGTQQVSNGVIWTFVHGGFGIVRITAVASGTSATADVIQTLPQDVVAQPTSLWSEGAWSDRYGYPSALATFQQRLVAAATPSDPRTLWFSAAGTTEVFEPGVEADDAFAYAIGGAQTVNRVLWLAEGARGLYIGALGEELSTASTDGRIAVGATTLEFRSGSTIGSRAVRPAVLNGTPIFVAKDRQRIVQIEYSFQDDRNVPIELSLPADHLGGPGFAGITLQYSPEPILWLWRDDGQVCLCVYDQQQDVLGWAPMPVAGGFVESASVTPSVERAGDTVTLIVRRTLDGQDRRCVEEVALTYGLQAEAPPLHEAQHLYCALRFEQEVAQDTFNLPHLVGQTVWAWTEKGASGPHEVGASGDVTLDAAVTRATIGLLDETQVIEELPKVAQTPEGSALGRLRHIGADTGVAVFRTADGSVETYADELGQPRRFGGRQDLIRRQIAADLTEAFTGSVNVPAISGPAADVGLIFRPRGPAPLTLAGLAASVDEVGP